MMGEVEDYRAELKKVHRIADMLCTAHGVERDRFRRRAVVLDVFLMLVSLYLVSMAFIDPALNHLLVPAGWDPKFWTGLVATSVFAVAMIQFIVNWKGKADAHERSFRLYAEAKSNCAELLNGTAPVSQDSYNRVRARYDMASDIGLHIPDDRFLKLKQKHLIKVLISKQLDEHPCLSIGWAHAKLWWRDNVGQRHRGQAPESDEILPKR